MVLIFHYKSVLCIDDFIVLCFVANVVEEILRYFVGIVTISISWLIAIFSSSKKIPPANGKNGAIYDDKETERLQNRILLLRGVGILPPA